jgi:tetratricopeptide (TPR) repeat protein
MSQNTFPTDLSAYAHRSLPRLPAGERNRFLKAWRLLGAGGILALIREGDLALAGPGVCEALLARSWAARHHDPGQMVHLASFAREVAGELRSRDLGSAGVAALQARAWAELANAFRVAGRLPAAEAAFEEAFGRSGEIADPLLSAHLLELRATLHGEKGDLESAARLLSIVTGIYDHENERHLAGRARITHSIYAALQGRGEDALRLSAEGLARIEPAEDIVLAMTALHNRLLLTLRLGAWDEARRTLALCRGFSEEPGAVALRLRWMQGSVLQELGETESAEILLRQAREGLAALGLGEPQPFSTRV